MSAKAALLINALIFAVLTPMPLHSSQVCSSPWSNFKVESGDAVVMGQEGPKGLTKVEIRVFKKTFSLSASDLRQLSGFSANGMRIYSEGGYEETGGEVYYIVFYAEKFGRKADSRTVSVHQNGSVKIEKGLFQ
ncbi:hypothetical protein GETHLI_22150 [Geothrix limicola]|uniref:Uncharacterized protein n=1 Tax=Geothrix limicola TaxID=2927978 RepID=A0ABQ5QGM7_9BACT|nr:hypothetical protein [Geothrix limicola]GLH73713.1 hypothetical protein GETHLI_22150 [Geothrix limicola]